MAGPDANGRAEETPLDLVPAALILPRLRRVALVALGVGLACVVVFGLLTTWTVGIVIGLVVAAPTAVSALLTMRRRIWLSGTTVHSRRAIGEKHVDLASAVSAELQVRAARVSQVILRIGDGSTGLGVGLALYTDTGGRELDVLALRRLADALSASELAAAAAVSSLLVEQLRAEARGAGLEERPLYAAVRLVRDAGRGPITTLSDAEVAGLLD